MYIKNSVGQGGKNNKNDVSFIQELINEVALDDMRIPTLSVDGKNGKQTEEGIAKFQRYIVKLSKPDSRIDPNGRTEKTLVAKVVELDIEFIPTLLKKYNLKKEKFAITGSGPRIISYRSNAKKVLSTYTENIVKLAMAYGGINKCDISSTIRTFDDQARIMYDNCSAYPAATSVATLRTARGWGYSTAGQTIEKIYFDNKSKSADETKKLMKDKIVELYKNGTKVSLHCVSESDYKNKNVLDIPYSSVPSNKRKAFEQALMGMAKETKNARYTQPARGEIYITRLIIENKCWHIEISQTNKPLPNQKKPLAPIRKKRPGTVSINITRNYIFDFLDDWF